MCYFFFMAIGCPYFLPPTAGGCWLVEVTFNLCLSVVLETRIQCYYCIVLYILLWYLPLWQAFVLERSNTAPFCVVLDCDRILRG